MKCKHGEFDPTKGCPKCVAEAAAAKREALFPTAKNLVKVKYIPETTGAESERAYSYFTEEPLAVGDLVKVPVKDRVGKAKVVEINVPEDTVAAFRAAVKTIPAGSRLVPQAADQIQGRLVVDEKASKEVGTLVADLKVNADPPAVINGGPYGVDEFHWNGGDTIVLVMVKSGNFAFIEGQPKAKRISEELAVKLQSDFKAAALLPNVRELKITDDVFALKGLEIDGGGLALAAELAGVEVTVQDVRQDAQEGPGTAVQVKVEYSILPDANNGVLKLYNEGLRLKAFAEARVIASNADLKPAVDDLGIIAKLKKALAEKRAEYVGPIKSELDAVNKFFASFLEPFDAADKLTRSKVTEYDNKVRAQAAEAARIEEEKAALARREAANNGTGEITVPLGTAVAPPPVPRIVRTETASVAGRDNWKVRVVDFAKLSDRFKLPNEQMLNALARSTKGQVVEPGVEFYNDRSVTVRTK